MIWNTIKAALGFGERIVTAKNDLKVARIEAEATAVRIAASNEGNWEAFAGQNARTSWLDEWWTVILSIPLIAAFFPFAVSYVTAGFKALEQVPGWYAWAVLASISFAFARKNMPDLSAWFTRVKRA